MSEAINDWLVYLGVANKMNTNDRGKVGHELKITTDIQDMEQDLTHVGVGVSQILPILVMCFLAGMGDSIILEQPELHLHPKVQTRLADFFVSMNVLGKQCILETHSEYLINRLRYLVAKTSDEKISQDTMIYFVEKEEGHSIYRNITINKYGVIDDWPKKPSFGGQKTGGASLFGGHLGDKVRQKSANKQYLNQKSAKTRTIFNT